MSSFQTERDPNVDDVVLNEEPPDPADEPDTRAAWTRWVVVAVVLGVAGTLYGLFRDALTLEALAAREQVLREFLAHSPVATYSAGFALYVGVTSLSLPGAVPLTLAFGWFFGFWPAVVLVSLASTTGATLAFLLSRFLLRDTFRRRFGERIAAFEENLEREGPFYLFTLRMIPAVPFFAINVAMGLTPIATGTFWWVSQLGMLPGTLVFVYAGSTIPELSSLADPNREAVLGWDLIGAFVLLGLFPFVVRALMRRFGPKTEAS